jgi:hypothetical protein
LQTGVLYWKRTTSAALLAAWRHHVLVRTRAEDLRQEAVRRRRRRLVSLVVTFWQRHVKRKKMNRRVAMASAHKALERPWKLWRDLVGAARKVASLMVEVTGLVNEVSLIDQMWSEGKGSWAGG